LSVRFTGGVELQHLRERPHSLDNLEQWKQAVYPPLPAASSEAAGSEQRPRIPISLGRTKSWWDHKAAAFLGRKTAESGSRAVGYVRRLLDSIRR
jgi:hypothetical protein